jgi:hypothetical protein
MNCFVELAMEAEEKREIEREGVQKGGGERSRATSGGEYYLVKLCILKKKFERL